MHKPDPTHSASTSSACNEALQMPVEESAMRAYLQRYPFAAGPDKAMNLRCTEAIHQKLALRSNSRNLPIRTGSDAVVRLRPEQTHLAPDILARLHRLMDSEQLAAKVRGPMINDFGWEANLIPRDAADVLVIGCGKGEELLFVRAVLPEARITAVDYTDTIPAGRKQNLGIRFFHGDMNGILDGFADQGERFDLVSSNHTLEHLYTPDEVLSLLGSLLRTSGALISTLPMDAVQGSPFLNKVTHLARRDRSKKIHPLDIVFLDAGHPWKTNPADLQATFLGAGFARVDLFQRAEHLSRSIAAPEAAFHARKRKGEWLHRIFFGLPRALTKLLFRHSPPALLVRALLAAEQRVWFGSNRLKNLYTQEVTVLAHKHP